MEIGALVNDRNDTGKGKMNDKDSDKGKDDKIKLDGMPREMKEGENPDKKLQYFYVSERTPETRLSKKDTRTKDRTRVETSDSGSKTYDEDSSSWMLALSFNSMRNDRNSDAYKKLTSGGAVLSICSVSVLGERARGYNVRSSFIPTRTWSIA